ncbi:MAG: fatty acid--CoA ligase family protein, partial [Mycobacterium sp.]
MTAQDTGSSPRISDLIVTTARRQPQARALVVSAERASISYRDLVRLVDDLAGQ